MGSFYLSDSRLWVTWLVAMGLAGCATVAPPPSEQGSPVHRQSLFEQRAASLARLDRWLISGRVAVSSDVESWQGTVNWRQSGKEFEVRIIGPLGQGAIRIRSASGVATLDLPDGESLSAESAAELLTRRLGWQLPVEALRHWMLGVPAPGAVYEAQLDTGGAPVRLSQNGWAVDYRRYQTIDGWLLPDKVFLDNGQWRVRMVVDQWRVGVVGTPDAQERAP